MIDPKIFLVEANIRAAYETLTEIINAMDLLQQAGMYPAVPHFQWQDRNGDGKYLYLIFRQKEDGSYSGPDGKRKLYIGANEDKQEEAKRLTKNRLTWQELEAKHTALARWIRMCESKLLMLQRDADSLLKFSNEFPKFELAKTV
jgi:hypothetical protein